MNDARSDRIDFLEQSYIRHMSRECERVGGINLGQGLCPLPSPPEVLESASDAILEDRSTYSPYEGVPELREALANKMADHNGLEIDPDEELVVTIGATGAFACAVHGLFDPGDEFMLFEPYYGYHYNTIRAGECTPHMVTLEPPEWTITRDQLEAHYTEATEAIVVNTPVNPSGQVLSRDELEVIAGFCRDHDILAITDEIYEYFVYDEREHISLATLPGMRERTVTISGFSKTFAITGWRLGYAVAPPRLADPVGLVDDIHYVCAPTPLQHGVARAMDELSDDYYRKMAAEFQERRDSICEALEAADLAPYHPEGAYYVLADVSRLGFDDSVDAAMHILEEGGVASVPGTSFYHSESGRDLVRFCYAVEGDKLREAGDRLQSLA